MLFVAQTKNYLHKISIVARDSEIDMATFTKNRMRY